MSIADSIIIDDEFESFNDPLETEEFEQLLSNVRADGKFTDPLICWDRDGDWVLIDGHNRWRIWKDFYDYDLKIEPHVVSLKFDDRDDVLLWIANHQRGRRNETPAARALKVLKLKPILERKAKARQAGGQGGVLLSQNSDEANEPLRVDEEMAKRAEVSRDTIRKVEAVASKGSADLQTAMKKGKVSVDVAAKAAELPAAKQAEVVKAINESPKPKKAAAAVVKAATPAKPAKPLPEKQSEILRKLKGNWKKLAKRDRDKFDNWVAENFPEFSGGEREDVPQETPEAIWAGLTKGQRKDMLEWLVNREPAKVQNELWSRALSSFVAPRKSADEPAALSGILWDFQKASTSVQREVVQQILQWVAPPVRIPASATEVIIEQIRQLRDAAHKCDQKTRENIWFPLDMLEDSLRSSAMFEVVATEDEIEVRKITAPADGGAE